MSKKYLIIKYFLTKGPNHERIYKEPFIAKYQIDNNCQNLDLNIIKNILSKEKISSIQDYRFLDKNKNCLIKIKPSSIIPIPNINFPKNFIILEIHIKEEIEFNKDFDYYESQKIKITTIKNKYSGSSLKTLSTKELKYLDILFLYANPLALSFVNNWKEEKKQEFNEQINYKKEIEIISKICEESHKNTFCNFECCNGEKLINSIRNSPSKIIHISCHGKIKKNNLYLYLENNGIDDQIDGETFKKKIGEKKIDDIELVFLSACYSEPFGKILIECGVKNVICIHSKTKILDEASIRFCELFYSALIKDSLSIKNAFNQAKNKFPEKYFNKKSFGICKNHEHDDDYCNFNSYKKEFEEKCSCEYDECNIHINTCPFFQKIKNENKINKFIIIKCDDKKDLYKICCCNAGDGRNEITTPHSEGTKFILYSQEDVIEEKYNNIFYDKIEGKLHINNECFLNYQYVIQNPYDTLSDTGHRLEMERIYSMINDGSNFNNYHFILIWGDIKIGKLQFIESLCIYLFERGVIKNFKFFIIFDDILLEEEMFDEIKKYKDEKLKNGKNTDKYLIIIKIPSDLEEKMIYYLGERVVNNEITNSRDNFYYIITFCSKDDKVASLIKYRNKCLGIHFDSLSKNPEKAKELLIKYRKKYNGTQKNEEIDEFLNKYSAYSSTMINFAISGGNSTNDPYYDTKEHDKNYMKNLSQKEIMKIYFLLKINPRGLLEKQIELIIPNFKKILDDNDKEKFINIDENFYKISEHHYVIYSTRDEDKKYCIEKCLEMYAKILYYYIKNKRWEKTINSEIEYNFNSYNKNGIWKTFNENLYNQCFNEHNDDKISDKIYKKISDTLFENRDIYEENIHKLISNTFLHIISIIGENEIYKEYLMQIIIMLPTIFSDDAKKCELLLNRAIKLCRLLNEQKNLLINGNNFIKEIERLELFLGSINSQFIFDNIVSEQYRKNLGIEGIAEVYFLKGIITKNEDSLNTAIECYNYIFSDLKKKKNGKMNKFNSDYLDYIETRLSYVYYKQGLIYISNQKYSEASTAFNIGKNRLENKDNFLRIKFDLELIKIEKKNNNYEMINKLLNKTIKMNPKYQNELNELKIKINKEIEADIIMLNSNPVKEDIENNMNNISTILNSHYYILNKLKNKTLNTSIRIESNVLNKNNLNNALNKEGKILIIQSDYCTDNGDIILENDLGECKLMEINELIQILPEIIKYQIVMLCFSNSNKLINIFENRLDISYLVTFGNISCLNMSENGLKKYKLLLDFLIHFIQNLNEFNIIKAFENSKESFDKSLQNLIHNDFNLIFLTKNKNKITSDSKLFDETEKTKFHPIVDLPKNCIDFNINCSDFTDIIYQIICNFIKDKEKIINIFLKDDQKDFKVSNKEINIKTIISAEIFKFFARHRDIFPGGVFYIKNSEKTNSIKLYDITKKKFKEEISTLPTLIIINNFWKIIDKANEYNVNILDKIQENISYLIITKSKFSSRKVCNIQIDQKNNEIFLNKYKKELSENNIYKTKKKYKQKNSNKNVHGTGKKYKKLVQIYHQDSGFVEFSYTQNDHSSKSNSLNSNDEESAKNSSEYNDDENVGSSDNDKSDSNKK